MTSTSSREKRRKVRSDREIINLPRFFSSTFDIVQLAKIYRHCWKEHLEISKMAKFESDILQNSENMVLQSREILQTSVCWGASLCPQYTNVCKISNATLWNYIFAILQDMNLKCGQFTNFKVSFSCFC